MTIIGLQIDQLASLSIEKRLKSIFEEYTSSFTV